MVGVFDSFTMALWDLDYLRQGLNAETCICLGFDVLKALLRLFQCWDSRQEPPVTESKDVTAALLCQ